MNALIALLAIAVLFGVVYLGMGAAHLGFVFGVIVPYAAIAIFLCGFVYRILKWAGSAVPFKIPTTCGQEKSLDFIRSNNLEAPSNTAGVVGRMLLEVLFFRSLFRNTRADVRDDVKIVYGPSKWLWAAGLAFHYSFLVIFLRHYRFFAEPVPAFVNGLQFVDGLFQIGVPIIYMTDAILLVSVAYLFLRRVFIPQLSYASLVADYFPLFLILAVGTTGVLMRYFYKVDIIHVKEMMMGLVGFKPVVPEGIGFLFFAHLFFVSALFAYFPFSKLMHLGGVFLSPTRNMINNSRRVRHVNPWNYDVKTHTYAEYEDEFRKEMAGAGMPLDKGEVE